jgi:hypothetical protein
MVDSPENLSIKKQSTGSVERTFTNIANQNRKIFDEVNEEMPNEE